MNKGSTLFSIGLPLNPQNASHFSGQAFMNVLVSADSSLGVPVTYMTFEPNAKTHWHKHPGGQILLCIEGKGYYQEWEGNLRTLNPGDVVEIDRNVKHWHGAQNHHTFSHLTLSTNPQEGSVEWLEAVIG